MLHVYPDYYKDFRCTAGACRHSCCIGWEIDLDEDKRSYYWKLPGPFGDRVRGSIDWEAEPPRFKLGQQDRCLFLNEDGLCDMILQLGEEALCDICREHPRFHNALPGRTEHGLGLCCEEAARLTLRRPLVLVREGEEGEQDAIIDFRDEALAQLEQGGRAALEAQWGAAPWGRSRAEWADFLAALERLEPDWGVALRSLKTVTASDIAALRAHLGPELIEYDRLAAHFLYRHLANGWDGPSLLARGRFALWAAWLLEGLGAGILRDTGHLTGEDRAQLARRFSAEIEYSDENFYILLEELG